jgi:hypothetical protein
MTPNKGKRNQDLGLVLIRAGIISVQCWKRGVTSGSTMDRGEKIYIIVRPIQQIRSNADGSQKRAS